MLSISLEYCIGLHCCRTILSFSFVPLCPCFETRFALRVLSTSIDTSRMLLVMSLSWWRGGTRSYSSPGMWLVSLRMRSVGSLRGLDSSASRGQWLNWDRRRWAKGVGREPSFCVIVHNTCEVFNSHLCGSMSHGGYA